MNRQTHTPEEETLAIGLAVAGVAVGLYLAARWLGGHVAYLTAGGGVLLTASVAGLVTRARWCDRRARRQDPTGPGVIVGSIRGDWRLARPRPFYIPWKAVRQHVLVCGPTGRGKSFTFLEPLLRAFVARRHTGVFYLDGKGDPIDQPNPTTGQAGVAFDHLFCPEDPARSARWNPLEGDDPIQAASLFAAALYPEASSAGANFYENRAVFAIRSVAPAIAFAGDHARPATDGHADPDAQVELPVAREPAPQQQRALEARLIDEVGMQATLAARLARRFPRRVAEQLRWLPYRDAAQQTPEALAQAIEHHADAPRSAPVATAIARTHRVSPSSLARILFSLEQLKALAVRLDAVKADITSHTHRLVLDQIHTDLVSLTQLPAKEHAAMLANLQNRLSVFLRPPFLGLCARSDFAIAEVCAGRRIGFLLSVGAFPDVAKQLGRIALSQFKNAVLASQPDIDKFAVLDELHNFISEDFGAFLNQSRGRGGGVIMGMQSIADFPRDTVQAMLGTTSSYIVTPGTGVDDRDYFAELFGKHHIQEQTQTYAPRHFWEPKAPPSIRTSTVERYRYTPTEIGELGEAYALIRLTVARRTYPVACVHVERAASKRPGAVRRSGRLALRSAPHG